MSNRLDRATWPEVPSAGALVLVPVGSTEQHGPHLPFTTDTVIARAVAERVAARLPAPVFVAPAIAFGNSGEHAGFPGTIFIGPEVLRLVLIETMRSLALWADRVVFVNGHGGNVRTLDDAVSFLIAEGHHVAWTPCHFPGGDAHAGRTESSVMLHLAPDEVRISAAAPGNTQSLRELMPELVKGGVKAVAPNGVLGDPTGATADEGRALLDALVTAMAERITAFTPDHRGRLKESA